MNGRTQHKFAICNLIPERPRLPPLMDGGRRALALRTTFARAVVGVFVFIALYCKSADALGRDKRAPWDPAGVEEFELTECHGQTVTKADLLGKPWLACFIFTRCAGDCPRVSDQMQLLARRLNGIDVRLVSLTVDPEN